MPGHWTLQVVRKDGTAIGNYNRLSELLRTKIGLVILKSVSVVKHCSFYWRGSVVIQTVSDDTLDECQLFSQLNKQQASQKL
jgi:hypothetical protein